GTPVRFILERNGKDITEKVTLKPFKEEPNRVGIGVSLFTDRNVKVLSLIHIPSPRDPLHDLVCRVLLELLGAGWAGGGGGGG
ncbi:hypothetical protein ACQ4LK_25885, partial [Bacillus pumilus]